MAKKLTKRKAFNFMRSYFDVLNEIPNDDDKLSFLLAVINKQFTDEDPKDLGWLSNLCYESQRHAIEKSVNGWKSVTKTDLLGNPLDAEGSPLGGANGSPLGGANGSPKQQVEVKEQEEVKEEVKDKVKPKQIFSEQVRECYYSILPFFDESTQPKNDKQISSWQETIDKLNRIDGLSFDDIIHLTQKTRENDFWSKNFLTINKLRTKNKEGIPYWKVFYNQFKTSKNEESRNFISELGRQARINHPDA